MPHRERGASIPRSASIFSRSGNVPAGIRFVERQLLTACMERFVRSAVAFVPPSASITSDAVVGICMAPNIQRR
jgi:hypothetical protein